ncbi:hypothetical protein FRC11_007096, partial [Ceratobasidium sp. 423]
MRIKEPSDQALDRTDQGAGSQTPGLFGNSPDMTSEPDSDAPPSYDSVPPIDATQGIDALFDDLDGADPILSSQGTNGQASTDREHSAEVPSANHTSDILDRIPNLFRLLDLVEDRSSGGIVEKIVIDQKSLSKVINILQPGAYKSVSNIDFKALDNLTIKPIGVYGNQLEILNYLQDVGCLDPGSEHLVFKRDSKGNRNSVLRSGLYLTMSHNPQSQGSSKTAYVFYWPEEATWDDQAASLSGTIRRNRETFMRYLTKLSEQTVALVSSSQAKGFVWETSARDHVIPEHQRSADAESRLEEFQVFELDEQEEAAITSPGFKISAESSFPIREGSSPIDADLVTGEEKIGLLTQTTKAAHAETQRFEESFSQMKLRDLIRNCNVTGANLTSSREGHPQLVLGKVSPESLDLLGSNGLREEYPDVFQEYDRNREELRHNLSLLQEEEKRQVDDLLARDKPVVSEIILELVYRKYAKRYPTLPPLQSELKHVPEIKAFVKSQYYKSGLDQVEKDIQQHKTAQIQDAEFRTLKSNWLYLKDRLDENTHLSESARADLVSKVMNEASEHVETETGSRRAGWVSRAASYMLGKVGLANDQGAKAAEKISDSDFVSQLPRWEREYPSLAQLIQPLYDSLRKDMTGFLDKLLAHYLDRIIYQERKTRYEAVNRTRESSLRDQMPGLFKSLLRSLREAMHNSLEMSNLCILRVDSVTIARSQNSQFSRSGNTWFYLKGLKRVHITAQTHYNVYPLELTEHDRHQCQTNEDHVPKPRLASMQRFHFALATDSQSIELIQLVQNKCLLVVSDIQQRHTRIFIEDNVKLNHAVQSQGKITLYHDKLGGSKCYFAFDQTTRFLAVVHGEQDLQVSVFEFDEQFTSLRRHRSPIDLAEWYDQPPDISGACFQTGKPELCLIESSGRIRVLSLVRRMFCGAPLEIDLPIVNVFPAPDGSCLLVAVAGALSSGSERLLAFHWQSFGSNQHGIDAAELPQSDTRRVGTRFYGRGRIHVISFTAADATITSTVLQVKQKTTEFAFLSENDGSGEERSVQTLNNSLIDCHLEVWTRFPVVPAVARDTLIPVSSQPRQLIFVSPEGLPRAEAYFSGMISTLRNTTSKPVGEDLAKTIVSSTNSGNFESFEHISEFKLGSYFVELICLIPLHLAITLDNKFMPLKDGVWDPEYESRLVGATIAEVNESLSLGWYESIFRSYMAKKARFGKLFTSFVRVVSSM